MWRFRSLDSILAARILKLNVLLAKLLCLAGILRTAVPDMDRETQDQYLVLLQAKDMGGHLGGLSGTTTVTVKLSDVNDNPPRFTQSESSTGGTVGGWWWWGGLFWGILVRSCSASGGRPWSSRGGFLQPALCFYGLEKSNFGRSGFSREFVLAQQRAAFSDPSDLQAPGRIFSARNLTAGTPAMLQSTSSNIQGWDFSASADVYQPLPILAVCSDYGT